MALVWAAPLWAASQPEAAGATYQAPSECPQAPAFEQQLNEQTKGAPVIGSGTAFRAFDVLLTSTSHGYSARVRLFGSDGTVTDRSLEDANCDRLAHAVALVIAIAAVPPEKESRAQQDTPGTAGALPQPRPLAQPPMPPTEALTQPVSLAKPPLRWGIGVVGGGALGLAPHVLPFAGIFGELRPTLAVTGRQAVFRASALGATSGETTDADVTTRFTWWAGRIEVCPMVVKGGAFDATACLHFDAGQLGAVGMDIAHPAGRRSVPWLATGALVRWGFQFDRLFAELSLDIGLPLRRGIFYVERPYTVVHHVPSVVESAGLSVGLHFP